MQPIILFNCEKQLGKSLKQFSRKGKNTMTQTLEWRTGVNLQDKARKLKDPKKMGIGKVVYKYNTV